MPRKENRKLDEAEPIGFSFKRRASSGEDEFHKAAAAMEQEGFKREADNSLQFNSSSSDVVRTPLLYVDPLWDAVLLLFPEDNLKEVNKRLRHYYKFQPIFGNCMDIHSTFPLSDFELMVDDVDLKDYYTHIKDKLDLLKMAEQMLREKNLLGESFHIGNWDKQNYEWKEWVHYPPEYVDVKRIPGSNTRSITILPDPEIQKIAHSHKMEDQLLADSVAAFNPKYYEMASRGEAYPVSEARVIQFANLPFGYTTRGYSIAKRVLKDLLYEDKLRHLQYTFVDRHLYPLKVFKLGSKEKGWIPGKKHFDKFKQLLVNAANDPDYSIIYHPFVEIDYVGTKDKIQDLLPHFDWVSKRIMIGLFANEALIGGESPGYSSQTVNLRMLFHRYTTTREEIQKVFKYKIYLPIAKAQNFIRETPAEKRSSIKIISKSFPSKRYHLPDFLWRKLNLLNNTTEQEFLYKIWEKGAMPFTVLADVFGYDLRTLEEYWKREQGTMVDDMHKKLLEKKMDENPEMAEEYLQGKPLQKILLDRMKKKQLEDIAAKSKPVEGAPPATEAGDSVETIPEISLPTPEVAAPEVALPETKTEESEELASPPGQAGEGEVI